MEITGVVVMEMRNDHVPDHVGLDADELERLHWAAQELPPAFGCGLFGEAGIDDNAALGRDCHPHEIIHRHRGVMRVAHYEMIPAHGVAGRVSNRKDFVLG